MTPITHAPDPPPPTSLLGAFWRREPTNWNAHTAGQGLVEYALILVLIAIVVIGALTTLGSEVETTYDDVSCALSGDCVEPVAPANPAVAGSTPTCPTGYIWRTDQGQGRSARCVRQ